MQILLVHSTEDAVAEGRMEQMAAPITLPLVGVELGTTGRHVCGDEAAARPRISMLASPKAVLTRLSLLDTDEGRAIV